jgi:DNA-directed RNA polymerase II subunit RPB1
VLTALLALLVAVIATASGSVALSPAASAATPGITSSMLYNGQPLQDDQVLTGGDQLDLKVQYDNSQVTPGSTVTFDVGSNVTVASLPATNTSIASVSQSGSTVTVTFKDPLPPDVNQGVFDIGLTVNNPPHSGNDDITWKVNSDQTSIPVVIKKQGDTPPPTTAALGKSVSPTDLNSYVHVAEDGTVTIDPTLANQAVSYTVTETVPAGASVSSISDQLPNYLGYDAGSFTYTQTTWDANGLNKTTSAPAAYPVSITGNSFTSSPALTGPTVVTISYTAHVTDPAGLANALQDQLEGKPGGTSYTAALQNTATDNTGQSAKATVNVRGTVPSAPCTGVCTHTLSKASSWDTRNVLTDADGNLTPAQEVDYTLKANVATTDATLPVNVVLSDPLPTGTSWDSSDASFITVSGTTTSLTEVASCPDQATFAGDTFVGQWCVTGQTLLVNLGNTKTTNVTIVANALVTSVAGLTSSGTAGAQGGTPYQLSNTASLDYGAANPATASKTITVTQLPANPGGGYIDASVFSKTAPAAPAAVNPGDSAQIPYVFKVGAGQGIDLTTNAITDFVDQSVFGDVDPSTLNPTGTYNGVALTAADFTLSKDATGDLVVVLSAAGTTIVTAQGIDKAFELDLTLTTLPFDGKVTKTITNSASLTGATGQPPYQSTANSTTTSYGSEAEVDKTLYDASADDYTGDLQATTNGPSTYVYKLDFIPHGGYNGVAISPVVDTLPAELQFLGFVTAANVPTAADPTAGPVDIGGNLKAVYDATAGTVTIEQQTGTVLDDASGDTLSAYFAVTIASLTAPIVNSIPNGPKATIEPVPMVSVGDYVWVDSNRNGRQDSGEPGIPGVVLDITGPDGQPVTGVDGLPVGPQTTDANGHYSFDGLPVLADGQHYTVSIDQDASKTALAPYTPTTAGVGDRAGDSSTWTAQSEGLTEDGQRDSTLDFGFVTKTYAIGDKVWIDTNKNGVQDGGEPPLAGVKVTLRDATGKTVATTTTDANGRYKFDNLPGGTYQVRFQLTPDQAAKYTFTSTGNGSVGTDSNANPGTGLTTTFTLGDSDTNLTASYTDQTVQASQGIDPTWDAGVVLLDTGSSTSPSSPGSSSSSVGGGSGTSPDSGGSDGAGGGLAMTGSDIAGMSVAALVALLGGTGLLLVGRARRRGAH